MRPTCPAAGPCLTPLSKALRVLSFMAPAAREALARHVPAVAVETQAQAAPRRAGGHRRAAAGEATAVGLQAALGVTLHIAPPVVQN